MISRSVSALHRAMAFRFCSFVRTIEFLQTISVATLPSPQSSQLVTTHSSSVAIRDWSSYSERTQASLKIRKRAGTRTRSRERDGVLLGCTIYGAFHDRRPLITRLELLGLTMGAGTYVGSYA